MSSRILSSEIGDRVAYILIRYLSGFKINYREEVMKILPPSLSDLGLIVFEDLASTLVEIRREDTGSIEYICRLCRRNFSTRKGLYLHLKRIHSSEITDLFIRELERLIEYNY